MSKVSDANRYPRRHYKDTVMDHINLDINKRDPPPKVVADTYVKNKQYTDVDYAFKPDNFNEIKPKVIYPEDEELSPPVYRQVIDKQMVNVSGKYYKRTDLTGKVSSR